MGEPEERGRGSCDGRLASPHMTPADEWGRPLTGTQPLTRTDGVAPRWRDSYPAAVRCLLADRESLTVYLRLPREHWPRIRHSNFIERTFGGTRRRVKVIGRLRGEHSCTSLVWAVLDRASPSGNDAGIVRFTDSTGRARHLLLKARRSIRGPRRALRSASAPSRHALPRRDRNQGLSLAEAWRFRCPGLPRP